MRDFPLLDLEDAYRQAHVTLRELEACAAELYADSEETWADMATVCDRARTSLAVLGPLPPGLVEEIAKDHADLREMEDHAS